MLTVKPLQRLSLLLSFLCFAVHLPLSAQLVAGEAYLQGNYVEVAVGFCGSYSSFYPPFPIGPLGAYHPTQTSGLGFVADSDMDGWSVGTPEFCGDYFVPGSPVEGWGIQIGSDSALINSDQYCVPNAIPGTVTSYVDLGLIQTTTWEGAIMTSSGDSISVYQQTNLPINELYFLSEVTICNLGTDTIFELYYNRNVDPDNEQPWTGDYTTYNEVLMQPPLDTASLVSAEGLIHGCFFAYGSIDSTSRVSYGSFNTGAAGDVWNATGPYSGSGSNTADEAVSIAFKRDFIAPGGCAIMTFAMMFDSDSNAIAEALNATAASVNIFADDDMLVGGGQTTICEGESVDLSIYESPDYSWTWSPSLGLDTDLGTAVVASPAVTTVYTVTGASTAGAMLSETVTVVVNPAPVVDLGPDISINIGVGDSAVLAASGGVSYSWSPTTGIIGGTASDASIVVMPATTTTYVVTVVGADGCVGSDTLTVNVVNEPSVGITEIDGAAVQISPNPVSAGDMLQLSGLDFSGNAQFNLIEMSGRLAYSGQLTIDSETRLEVPADLAEGIYFLQLNAADGTRLVNTRIVVQK